MCYQHQGWHKKKPKGHLDNCASRTYHKPRNLIQLFRREAGQLQNDPMSLVNTPILSAQVVSHEGLNTVQSLKLKTSSTFRFRHQIYVSHSQRQIGIWGALNCTINTETMSSLSRRLPLFSALKRGELHRPLYKLSKVGKWLINQLGSSKPGCLVRSIPHSLTTKQGTECHCSTTMLV